MRFRRETGDFSINLTLDEETNKPKDIQLPKGLSGEDLLGVITSTPVTEEGVTYTEYSSVRMTNDYGPVVAVFGSTPRPLYYDPTTGILSANAPSHSDGGGQTK